jgi:hypothetical protein
MGIEWRAEGKWLGQWVARRACTPSIAPNAFLTLPACVLSPVQVSSRAGRGMASTEAVVTDRAGSGAPALDARISAPRVGRGGGGGRAGRARQHRMGCVRQLCSPSGEGEGVSRRLPTRGKGEKGCLHRVDVAAHGLRGGRAEAWVGSGGSFAQAPHAHTSADGRTSIWAIEETACRF